MIAQPPCDAPTRAIRSGSTKAHVAGVVDRDEDVAGALGAHEDLSGADQPPDLVVREAARGMAVDDDRRPAVGDQHRRPAVEVVLRAVAAGIEQRGREAPLPGRPGDPVVGAQLGRERRRLHPVRRSSPGSGRASCRRPRAARRPQRPRSHPRPTSLAVRARFAPRVAPQSELCERPSRTAPGTVVARVRQQSSI